MTALMTNYETAISDRRSGVPLTWTPRGMLPSLAVFFLGGALSDDEDTIEVDVTVEADECPPTRRTGLAVVDVVPDALDLGRGSVPDLDELSLDLDDLFDVEARP